MTSASVARAVPLACLMRLRGVDAVEADVIAPDRQGIAVDHPGSLGMGGASQE